jgi:hypothetical protein
MSVHLIENYCSTQLLAACHVENDGSFSINFVRGSVWRDAVGIHHIVKGSFWRELRWVLFAYIVLLKVAFGQT